MPPADRVLVVACGALAKELRHLTASLERNGRGRGIDLECLPAKLHNRPEMIPEAVRARVRAARSRYRTILVGSRSTEFALMFAAMAPRPAASAQPYISVGPTRMPFNAADSESIDTARKARPALV